jgi:Tfp pilus assembly protein FimT
LAELSVVLAVIGTLFSLALPSILNYYQTAQVRGAASDIAAYINQGRQMAIQQNCSVTVQVFPDSVRYSLGGNCQSPGVWKGAGTDNSGKILIPAGITLDSTANPVFSNLGAAAPAATLTVSNGSYSLSVLVSGSGRVTVAP